MCFYKLHFQHDSTQLPWCSLIKAVMIIGLLPRFEMKSKQQAVLVSSYITAVKGYFPFPTKASFNTWNMYHWLYLSIEVTSFGILSKSCSVQYLSLPSGSERNYKHCRRTSDAIGSAILLCAVAFTVTMVASRTSYWILTHSLFCLCCLLKVSWNQKVRHFKKSEIF